MKILIKNRNIVGLGSLLALTLSFSALPAHAGPSPQFFNEPQYVTAAVKEAAAVQPANSVAAVCNACKTVGLRESKHVGPTGKGRETWAIGAKHTCEHCGGSITVVNGATKDSMAANCGMCGKGSDSHCVAEVKSS
jgi:hypothetical protein